MLLSDTGFDGGDRDVVNTGTDFAVSRSRLQPGRDSINRYLAARNA